MPWEPLRELRAWQERLDRLSAHHPQAWLPPMDVYETDDRFVVSAELPGLTREDVSLAIEATRLTISGRRGRPADSAAVVHFHRVERAQGEFSRTLEFSSPIDAAQVRAELQHGVLTISLPKAPASGPRSIEVL